jgi:hypothetical protein
VFADEAGPCGYGLHRYLTGLAKIRRALQRLKYWPVEPLLKIDGGFRGIIECQVDSKPTDVPGANDRWQERQGRTSVQWSNLVERLAGLHLGPVGFEFSTM